MKKLSIAFVGLCITGVLWARFDLLDLVVAPREGDVAQFLVQRSDTQPTRKMTRAEFLSFFRDGRFAVGRVAQNEIFSTRYDPVRSDQPDAPKSMGVFCQGAFATKSGEVFLWRLVKERVLEIENIEHHTGWLILDPLPKK